jgi:hypothetical protein
MNMITWTGEVGRPLGAHLPCGCGCDEREGAVLGYFTASNDQGEGFTLVFRPGEDDEAWAAVARVLNPT